jgi:hypothetical protein
MLNQIGLDKKLCKLLVDYEDKSEIIGMMEFLRDLQMNPPVARSFEPRRDLLLTTRGRRQEDRSDRGR